MGIDHTGYRFMRGRKLLDLCSLVSHSSWQKCIMESYKKRRVDDDHTLGFWRNASIRICRPY